MSNRNESLNDGPTAGVVGVVSTRDLHKLIGAGFPVASVGDDDLSTFGVELLNQQNNKIGH